MGVTQGAGLSLRWFREQFGTAKNGRTQSYDEMTAEAATVPAGADGLLWTPYLMGERTPHLDPHARGALVGLTAQHTRAHVIRAILEGVAFSLRDTLTIFRELNVPVNSIRLGGGGARSSLWQQIQADIYGMPVDLIGVDEGPAYGAVLLAGVGTGVWPSVAAACETAVHVAKRVQPIPANVQLMSLRYEEYRKIYPALRTVSHSAGGGQ
jgi:xylulokinase